MSNQHYRRQEKQTLIRAAASLNKPKIVKYLRQSASAIALISVLAACQGQVSRHGHVFTENEVEQVREGMTKDQVVLTLGTPDTKSTVGNEAFYYISTTTKRPIGFMEPAITDRTVVAVYFDKSDTVQRVANYGLKDGKVFDFIKRETPAHGNEEGLLKSLFRNIGRPAATPNPTQER